MTVKTFTDVVTFSRGAGKTRTNAAGLIVGVDFSSTSNTVTTGSKTFTLAADANVNRDWATGSSVRAVDQVGGGVLVGTVTSYAPSNQSLVINVATVTGSGTGTNWRIGSLEMTRDVASGAVNSEPASTNLITFSEQFNSAAWQNVEMTVTANAALSPNGSADADLVVPSNTNTAKRLSSLVTANVNSTYTFSCFAKKPAANGYSFLALAFGATAVNGGNRGFATFDISLGQVVSSGVTGNALFFKSEITTFPDGWYRCSVTFIPGNGAETIVAVSPTPLPSAATSPAVAYTGDGTSGVLVWGAQLELNASTSYIPTTTAQVTKSADSFALTSTALTAISQGQGTLYVEAESADSGPSQKRAIRLSGATGDIRLAKRGVGNLGGFTKMLEVDNDLYFGVIAGNSQRDTGKEIGAITVAVNERTGLPESVNTTNSWAYDGSNEILYAGGSTEERLMKKDLSLWSGKGFGNIEVRGGTYTGSRFIFSSGTLGVVFLSDDDISWKRVNTPVLSQITNEVVSATVGGVLRTVIVGNTGFIAVSDNQGDTWLSTVTVNGTPTSVSSGRTTNIAAITFGAGLFVAAVTGVTTTAISTSPNGVTWTTRTTPAITANDVAYNGTNLFVLVGNGGVIQTSADGISWTSRTSNVVANLTGVHFANGLWVAVGATGAITTSPDGITWTAQTSGVTANLQEVNFFNSLFIAVGATGTVVTSANGVNWTTRTSPTTSTLIGIAASNSRAVLGGVSGAVLTTEEGTTYTSRTNNNAAINGMAFGNGVFVSVGNAQGGSGYIATIDPVTSLYTRRVSGTTQAVNNVRFLRGAYYAVGNASVVLRSLDAIAYSLIAVGGTAFNIFDIADSGALQIAVGSGGRYSTSTDGTTFSTSALNGQTTQQLNGIDYFGGQFVAVGNAGTIITSPNGAAWVARTSGTTANLTSVMYSVRDQLWYTAGAAGTMLFSADAINWQSVQNAGFASVDNTGLQANPMLPLWTNGRNKIAISYKDNQVIASINGVSKTDLIATIPTLTAGALAENLNGLIYKTQVFPDAISEIELNALTGL